MQAVTALGGFFKPGAQLPGEIGSARVVVGHGRNGQAQQQNIRALPVGQQRQDLGGALARK